MSRAGRSGRGAVLRRAMQDVRLGLSRADGLKRLAARTEVPELRHFVLAMVRAEAYGVPIAQILRVQASELRDKRRRRAEETAMKIPVKVVFPLVFCILPTLFIIVIGPAVLRLAATSWGG